MKKHILSALVVIAIHGVCQAQKLNRIEKKIVKQVQAMDSESIDFLEKVVNVNSGTLNKKGVREVGTLFDRAFKSIGFNTKAHRPAYGGDGDYFSKPSEDDVFEAAYAIMHETNPKKFPVY